MKTIKGPGLFLAQFADDAAPFHALGPIGAWAAGLGYKAVQIPSGDKRLFDLDLAASSQTYCDELKGELADQGLQVSELSAHLQGQLVAVHPAYDLNFDAFAPKDLQGNPAARSAWAADQVKKALTASRNLGLNAMAAFSGALAWPYLYPWPQRPAGLVEEAFGELARRWQPLLDHAEEMGVDICYELHPGEDLHDGVSYEIFLKAVGNHPRFRLLYGCIPGIRRPENFRREIRCRGAGDIVFRSGVIFRRGELLGQRERHQYVEPMESRVGGAGYQGSRREWGRSCEMFSIVA